MAQGARRADEHTAGRDPKGTLAVGPGQEVEGGDPGFTAQRPPLGAVGMFVPGLLARWGTQRAQAGIVIPASREVSAGGQVRV